MLVSINSKKKYSQRNLSEDEILNNESKRITSNEVLLSNILIYEYPTN